MKKKSLKKSPRKIHLNRETIKALQDEPLKAVAGGATSPLTRCGESWCFC